MTLPKVGYTTPTLKSGGTRTPRTPKITPMTKWMGDRRIKIYVTALYSSWKISKMLYEATFLDRMMIARQTY